MTRWAPVIICVGVQGRTFLSNFSAAICSLAHSTVSWPVLEELSVVQWSLRGWRRRLIRRSGASVWCIRLVVLRFAPWYPPRIAYLSHYEFPASLGWHHGTFWRFVRLGETHTTIRQFMCRFHRLQSSCPRSSALTSSKCANSCTL